MGVDVDEAGSDDLAACVDFLGASAEAFADRDDPVDVDCDISDKGRAARTIDDGAAANHQIIHVRLPNLLARCFSFTRKTIKIGIASCRERVGMYVYS